MTIIEIILTGISLAMDAFAISIYKGLANNNQRIKKAFIIAAYFGLFQTLMPIIGYYLGNIFTERIIILNPYLSTILLITIGILMLKENNNEKTSSSIKTSEMVILSIATSIDALIIGISLSFFKNDIIPSSIIIGIITFIICFLGFLLGNILNNKLGKYSNKIGGITLIIIGIKTFVQNLLK